MSAQEAIALYRSSGKKCRFCQRIITRYEKTLQITFDDLKHLEACIMRDEF